MMNHLVMSLCVGMVAAALSDDTWLGIMMGLGVFIAPILTIWSEE